MLSTSTRGCCSCCNSGPAQDETCKTIITSADLAELFYIAGLDEELCCKYQEIAEVTNIRDCAGNPIARTTPIVTCADFVNRLCLAIAAMDTGSPVVLQGASVGTPTLLVGSDCDLHTVPETPLTVVDTTCINLTASGEFNHTLTAALTVSPDAGNMLSCTGNGAFVPETPLVANDSATIDFTTSGTANHTLTGSVKISAVPNNCVIAQADGIYVECTDLCDDIGDLPVGAPSVPGVSSFVGTDCQTHLLTETEFTAVDTSTIDFSTAGSFGHQLTGSVKISTDPDNLITVDGTGIKVTCDDVNDCVVITPTTVAVEDTQCINMTVVEFPAQTYTISAVPILSPAPDNALTCTVNGLYVPESPDATVIVPLDTSCINMAAVEAPAGTWTISATPIIDPNPANILTCGVNGLLVTGTSATTVTGDSTNCIDVNVVETSPDVWEVTADPIIAPNHVGYAVGCNGLTCTGAGLSAPPDVDGYEIEEGSPTPPIVNEPYAALETDTVTGPIINIDNPSNCRSAVLSLGARIPELEVTQNSGSGTTRVRVLVEHDINLPGVLVTGGFVTKTEFTVDIDAPAAGTRIWKTHGADLLPRYLLPPGFAGGTYQVRITVSQEVGTSDNVMLNNIVTRGSLVTVGA